MKICPKCNLSQNDSRTLCIDCGAKLGNPISDEEREKIEHETSENIEEALEKKELSYIGPLTKVFAAIDIAGIIGAIIVMNILKERPNIAFSVYALLFFIVGLVIKIFPMLGWKLDMLKLSMKYNIDSYGMYPSEGRIASERAMRIISTVIGLLLLSYGILVY